MATMFKKRKSKGRQKIEIKKIEKEEARQICFSKRKAGIFKKANELAVLCGAEVGIVAFSPAGKPFSFGHPNIHPVIDRYLAAGEASTSQDLYLHHPGTYYVHEGMRDLQREHEELATLVTAVKRQQGEMKKKLWWDDLEGLGIEELMEYVKVLEQLKMKVVNRAEEKNINGLHHGAVHPGIYGSDEMRRVEALNLQPMSIVHPGFGSDDQIIRGADQAGLSLHASSTVHPAGYGSDEMRRFEALNLQPMSIVHPGFGSDDQIIRGADQGLSSHASSVHPGYGYSDEMRRVEALNLHGWSSVHPGFGCDEIIRGADQGLSLHAAGSVHPGFYLDGFSDQTLINGHKGLHGGHVLPGCSFGGLDHHELNRSTVESLHAGVLPGCSFGGLDHVESLHAGFGHGFF